MIYILYDTALNGPYTLMLLQNAYPVNQSLFKGTKDEVLSDVAPYLFQVDDQLFKKINDPIASLKAIVVLESAEKINNLLSHFHQFIYIKKNGQENYFRFWDARVLAKFLPESNDEKLNDFFEGITCFYNINSENAKAESFYLKRGKLQTADMGLHKLFLLNDLEAQHTEPENLATTQNEPTKKEKRKYFG